MADQKIRSKTFEGPNNNINEHFNFELNESLKDLEYLKIVIRVWQKANILDFTFQNTEIGNLK